LESSDAAEISEKARGKANPNADIRKTSESNRRPIRTVEDGPDTVFNMMDWPQEVGVTEVLSAMTLCRAGDAADGTVSPAPMSADVIPAPTDTDTDTDIASLALCEFIHAPDHFWGSVPKGAIQTRRRAGGYLSMTRRRLT
jgi:hypothetical protein